MSVHSFVAAERVCQLRESGVSNLPLNKILYFAQMVRLGRTDGLKPLVSESFQAWDYGPVLPSIYRRARIYGSEVIPASAFSSHLAALSTVEDALIVEVTESLRDLTPGQLVALTHQDDGAWASHYVPGEKGIVIPNQDIFQEYFRRVREE